MTGSIPNLGSQNPYTEFLTDWHTDWPSDNTLTTVASATAVGSLAEKFFAPVKSFLVLPLRGLITLLGYGHTPETASEAIINEMQDTLVQLLERKRVRKMKLLTILKMGRPERVRKMKLLTILKIGPDKYLQEFSIANSSKTIDPSDVTPRLKEYQRWTCSRLKEHGLSQPIELENFLWYPDNCEAGATSQFTWIAEWTKMDSSDGKCSKTVYSDSSGVDQRELHTVIERLLNKKVAPFHNIDRDFYQKRLIATV